MPKFDPDLAAAVLVEAAFTTDAAACAKYGVSERSLQRWRQMLAHGHDLLAGCVATKKKALDAQWADALPIALKAAVETVGEMSLAIRKDATFGRNPFALEKVAGAMKLLADVYYTGKLIDARIAQQDREAGGLPLPGDTEGESDYTN